MLQLSPRLAAIAGLVPPGASIADVGTDHGYLPIFLIASGRAVSAIAADLRPGPLDAARAHVRAAGLEAKISLRLCDGLAGIDPAEADTLILAGMGGETILGLLERAPWALAGDKLLLLQPQSKQAELRAWLYAHRCGVRSEHLVRDDGKLYPILCAGGAPVRALSPAETLVGVWPPERRDALFCEYLEETIKKVSRAAAGLARAERPADPERLAFLWQLLTGLNEMRRETKCQTCGK